MIFTQYYLECLSQASYLIGDEGSGQAVVVDPRRDVSEYLADAVARELRIVGVINTHFHADFLAGHLELAAQTGAWIGYGSRAEHGVPDPAPRRRRAGPARRRDFADHGDPRAHPGVDQRAGVRARRRRRALWRAHRRRSVHRRRRTPGPAGLGRRDRRRAGPPAVRERAEQADGVARRGAGIPGARRRLGVREEPVHRAAVHHRRATPDQLCVPADERVGVPGHRHRRPAARAGVLRLRRRAEPPAARALRPRPPPGRARPGRSSWPAGRRARWSWTPAGRGTSPRATSPAR